MITDIYIEATTWAEVVKDLEKFKETFNNKCRVSIKVAPPIVDTAGYSFNWLANDSSDAKTEFVNGIVNEVTEKLTAAVEKSNAVRQYKTQEGTNMQTGAIKFEDFKGLTSMPQKAATAWAAATEGLLGVGYVPLVFVGTQPVRGVNYWFIALKTLVTAEPKKEIVKMAINEFQGEYAIDEDKTEVIFG